jgi:hypothetical protein
MGRGGRGLGPGRGLGGSEAVAKRPGICETKPIWWLIVGTKLRDQRLGAVWVGLSKRSQFGGWRSRPRPEARPDRWAGLRNEADWAGQLRDEGEMRSFARFIASRRSQSVAEV